MQASQKLESQLNAASWAIVLLWGAICFLTALGWGVGLLGAAAILVGTQRLRVAVHLGVQRFWVIVGGLIAAAGLWHLFDVRFDLGSVRFMIVGAAALAGVR